MYKVRNFRINIEVDPEINLMGTFYCRGRFLYDALSVLLFHFKDYKVEVYDFEEDKIIYNDVFTSETPDILHEYAVKDYQTRATLYLESLIGLPDGNGGEILADDIFKAINILKGDLS